MCDLFENKHNKDKENGNKENELKLKNKMLLKLFKASEAIVGEVKKLIGEFEEVFDEGLKEELDEQESYKRRFYKNQGRRLKDLDLYYYIPEVLFLDSLPDYVMGGLKDYDTDNEFKTNRARLFSKFLSNKEDVCVENEEDNEEGEVVVVEEDVEKNTWQKAYNAFKRQLSGKKKQGSLKKQGSFKKEEPLTRHESLKKLGSWKKQNSLKTQGSFNETLKKQESLKTQGSFNETLKTQNPFFLGNCKPNWRDVVKYTTRLNDICKVFKMKDVDTLLLTKKDKFYFNIEHRKNLRKLNR
ncbi:unnamed protein product [Meloidogyne enterolobii]|uniref:Uncharacterized protein n=1 Tax=Meloidogyne enterolobii TaxID=390850 RepID=A0ACB1A555_MELEN